MRRTRLGKSVWVGTVLSAISMFAAGARADSDSAVFSISPDEFRAGASATAQLSISSTSIGGSALSTGDHFTFIFDSSVGTVSSMISPVSVSSASLLAADFSATASPSQVVIIYNGARKSFAYGDTLSVEVSFTAAAQVGTGKVSFSSPFTHMPGGNLPYIPVSVVDFANGGVTSVAHDATLTGDGTSGAPLGVVGGSVAVTHDTTLTGNGTTGTPLGVVPGSVPVAHDVTLTGNGTTGTPLAVVPVPIAHDTTLAGNGTAGMPLSVVPVSVSIAHDATLTGNGTSGTPLSVVAGSVPIAHDATITGNGTTGTPLGVAGGSVAVAHDATLTGNGTTGTPLGVAGGSVAVAHDATLTGNGTTGTPLGVAGGSLAVAHDATLTGNGTTGTPLSVAGGSVAVAHDATLTGNGTAGTPLGVAGGSVAVAHDATLTGNGTTVTPLGVAGGSVAIAHDGTLSGNGTTGTPLGVVSGSVPISHDATLTGNGTNGTPISVTFPLTLMGDAPENAALNVLNTAQGVGIHASGNLIPGSTGDGGIAIIATGGHSNSSGTGGDGLFAVGGPGGGGISNNGKAGFFDGDVLVTGTLSKGGGSFKIDHPLDPANKYLYHSFVESPDMMNIYNGNVTLDSKGEALVELPAWFGALNKDFRYLLTAIGAPGPGLYIAEEVADNRFKVAGGAPGMRISWQVTGVRQDAWANAHRIPVEEPKSEIERGHYIHPELFDQPEEKGIQWARHPDVMRQMKDRREQQMKQVQGAGSAAAAGGKPQKSKAPASGKEPRPGAS